MTDKVSDDDLLKHFNVLAKSTAFMKFIAPDLLLLSPTLLKELFLLALNDDKFRARVTDIYHGHVGSGKIKLRKIKRK
jgi:hypothetical protein